MDRRLFIKSVVAGASVAAVPVTAKSNTSDGVGVNLVKGELVRCAFIESVLTYPSEGVALINDETRSRLDSRVVDVMQAFSSKGHVHSYTVMSSLVSRSDGALSDKSEPGVNVSVYYSIANDPVTHVSEINLWALRGLDVEHYV